MLHTMRATRFRSSGTVRLHGWEVQRTTSHLAPLAPQCARCAHLHHQHQHRYIHSSASNNNRHSLTQAHHAWSATPAVQRAPQCRMFHTSSTVASPTSATEAASSSSAAADPSSLSATPPESPTARGADPFAPSDPFAPATTTSSTTSQAPAYNIEPYLTPRLILVRPPMLLCGVRIHWDFDRFSRDGAPEDAIKMMEEERRAELREVEEKERREWKERNALLIAQGRDPEPPLEWEQPYRSLTKKGRKRVRDRVFSTSDTLRILSTVERQRFLDCLTTFASRGQVQHVGYLFGRFNQAGLGMDEEIAAIWLMAIARQAIPRRKDAAIKNIKAKIGRAEAMEGGETPREQIEEHQLHQHQQQQPSMLEKSAFEVDSQMDAEFNTAAQDEAEAEAEVEMEAEAESETDAATSEHTTRSLLAASKSLSSSPHSSSLSTSSMSSSSSSASFSSFTSDSPFPDASNQTVDVSSGSDSIPSFLDSLNAAMKDKQNQHHALSTNHSGRRKRQRPSVVHYSPDDPKKLDPSQPSTLDFLCSLSPHLTPADWRGVGLAPSKVGGEKIHTLLDWFQRYKLVASYKMIRAFFDVFAIDNDLHGAINLIVRLSKQHHHVNGTTYAMLIDSLAKYQDGRGALYAFLHMERAQFRPKATTFNALIRCFASQGDYRSAWKLTKEMQAHQLTPDNATFASIIEGCCKAGKPDLAKEMFDYVRKYQKQHAIPIAGKMQQQHRQLLSDSGEMLTNKLEQQSSQQQQPQHLAPHDGSSRAVSSTSTAGPTGVVTALPLDARPYAVLISEYVRQKQLKQAIGVLNDMVESGVVPLMGIYMELLHACTESHRPSEGRQLWRQMLQLEITPDVLLYTAYLPHVATEAELKQLYEGMIRGNTLLSAIRSAETVTSSENGDDADYVPDPSTLHKPLRPTSKFFDAVATQLARLIHPSSRDLSSIVWLLGELRRHRLTPSKTLIDIVAHILEQSNRSFATPLLRTALTHMGVHALDDAFLQRIVSGRREELRQDWLRLDEMLRARKQRRQSNQQTDSATHNSSTL